MKIKPLRIISGIIIIAILFCIYFMFTDFGGDSLGNVIETIIFTSVILFIASTTFLILFWKNIDQRKILLIVFLISFPLTYKVLNYKINELKNNRNPNLKSFYERPINKITFEKDSLNSQKAINSLIKMKNANTEGIKRIYAKIDTIIYSPNTKKIFVIYMEKFEKNGLGNDLNPSYLSANMRNNEGDWEFQEGPENVPNYGGSFHNEKELKLNVRRYYFNRYSFDPNDKDKEEYFWK